MQKREGEAELPFHDWFNQSSYKVLGGSKHSFLLTSGRTDPIALSPIFRDFRRWITAIREAFRLGIRARDDYIEAYGAWLEIPNRGPDGEPMPRFDEETLGGHLCYSALVDPARHLGGELENLDVRYDPETL